MIISAAEIAAEYRQAKKPLLQIGILADMNACKRQEIVEILREAGCELPERYKTANEKAKANTSSGAGAPHSPQGEGNESQGQGWRTMANLEFCTAVPIATESELKCEKKASYKELNGIIWNNLVDTMSVLRQICMHLEGDASTPKDIPEFKCYRDVLEASNNLSYEVLKVVNQIAEVIGVA